MATGFVIGLDEHGQARAWPLPELHRDPVVNDTVGDRPVLVVYDEKTVLMAAIFDRTVDDRVLTFASKDGKLVDKETGSEWDVLTGEATTPPMKSKKLKQLPGIVTLNDRWKAFHPKTTYWKPALPLKNK